MSNRQTAQSPRTAAGTSFTPAGNIAASTVQAAIEELDTEKAPLASPTFTGTVTVPDASFTPAKLDNGAAVSVLGRSANSSGARADIAAGANDRVLRRVSNALDFGQLTVGMFPDAVVTPAKLDNGSALSVLGRSANSSGARADIAAGSDHQVLRRSGTAIGFGAVDLAQANAVTGVLPAANLPDSSTTAEGVSEQATAAEYRTKTDTTRHLGVAEVWTAALAATLTDGANIAVNFANGFNWGGSTTTKLSLGGNRTLDAPTNVVGGQAGILWFGASGSTRTLTLNAAWNLCTGVEAGPYSITTSQTLGIAYVTLGSTVYVTAILRI